MWKVERCPLGTSCGEREAGKGRRQPPRFASLVSFLRSASETEPVGFHRTCGSAAPCEAWEETSTPTPGFAATDDSENDAKECQKTPDTVDEAAEKSALGTASAAAAPPPRSSMEGGWLPAIARASAAPLWPPASPSSTNREKEEALDGSGGSEENDPAAPPPLPQEGERGGRDKDEETEWEGIVVVERLCRTAAERQWRG